MHDFVESYSLMLATYVSSEGKQSLILAHPAQIFFPTCVQDINLLFSLSWLWTTVGS